MGGTELRGEQSTRKAGAGGRLRTVKRAPLFRRNMQAVQDGGPGAKHQEKQSGSGGADKAVRKEQCKEIF